MARCSPAGFRLNKVPAELMPPGISNGVYSGGEFLYNLGVAGNFRKYIFLFPFLIFLPSLPQAGQVSPCLQSVIQSSAPSQEIFVIITLSDQADLSLLRQEKNESLRRKMMARQLRNKADITQGPLKAFLGCRGPKRMISLWSMNGIVVTVEWKTLC
jgi:hypothetical protein